MERTRGRGRGGEKGKTESVDHAHKHCNSSPEKSHEALENCTVCLSFFGEGVDNHAFEGKLEREGKVATPRGKVREMGLV